jgi:hypothetical protein
MAIKILAIVKLAYLREFLELEAGGGAILKLSIVLSFDVSGLDAASPERRRIIR